MSSRDNSSTTAGNNKTYKPRIPSSYVEELSAQLAQLPENTRTIEYRDRVELCDADLSEISTKSGLRLLDISGCSRLSDDSFADLSALSSLQILKVSRVSLTDAAVVHIGNISSLEIVDLSYNEEITDKALASLARIPNLKQVIISGCDQITDRGLKHLAGISSLLRFSAAYCPRISTDGIKNLLENCENMTDLSLHHSKVGKGIIEALSKSKKLKNVDLSFCVGISASVQQELKEKYPKIEFLFSQ